MEHVSDFDKELSGNDFDNQGSTASFYPDKSIDIVSESDNNSVARRQFVKIATTVAGGVISGASVFNTTEVSAVNRGKTSKLRWIDTHIHVSDIGRDGKKREQMLEDLLEVLDRDEADLRFVISP